MFKEILVVGDVHLGFENKATLKKIYRIAEVRKPSIIVQIGDLYDLFAASSFVKPTIKTLEQEINEAMPKAERFWYNLQKAAPKAKCFQLKGNHDIRPMLRMRERAPDMAFLYDDSKLWRFKGVETIYDSRQELVIDDMLFIHGYRTKIGDHAKYAQRKVVCGHSHTGGTVFMNTFDGEQIWELNAGYCGDPLSYAFNYMKQKFTKWTQGYGYIDRYGPRFCDL